MIHHFYNEWHLGDSLVHLHFLRHLALKHPEHVFVHAAKENLLVQLRESIEDVPNVQLIRLEDHVKYPGVRWINSWKNAGCVLDPSVIFQPGFWDTHPNRNDFSGFYLEFFGILARQMGLETPFHTPADLWFDYPKIKRSDRGLQLLSAFEGCRGSTEMPFDILVVNAMPLSNQFLAFKHPQYLTPLIEELATRHRVVVTNPLVREPAAAGSSQPPIPCTWDHRLTITEIGGLSLHCPYLLMVSTGPKWPTFNVWNRDSVKLRVVLLDVEVLNLGGNTVQANSREAAREVLVSHGLL